MKARENPFASWRLEQVRYRFDRLNWDELLRRFDGLGRRAALVGDHGTGKTTLLEEFAARFRQQGFRVFSFRLTQDEPASRKPPWSAILPDIGARDMVLLDGSEQLNRWEWQKFRRLSRSAGGLLVTMHHAGRLPTLYECRTTPQLLASLVVEMTTVPEWPLTRSPEDLFREHRGNLREAFRALYDEFAEDNRNLKQSRSPKPEERRSGRAPFGCRPWDFVRRNVREDSGGTPVKNSAH